MANYRIILIIHNMRGSLILMMMMMAMFAVDEQNLHWRRHHQIFQKGYQSIYCALRMAFHRVRVPFWENVTH